MAHKSDEQNNARGFASGFVLGLALGGVVVGLIALSIQHSTFLNSVSASAGDPWFTLSAEGTATLEGWLGSAYADNGGPMASRGAVSWFEIGTRGELDGIEVSHRVPVYLTRDTQMLVDGTPYNHGRAKSAGEALFDWDSPNNDLLYGRVLVVEFHKEGEAVVADKISVPLKMTPNPMEE